MIRGALDDDSDTIGQNLWAIKEPQDTLVGKVQEVNK